MQIDMKVPIYHAPTEADIGRVVKAALMGMTEDVVIVRLGNTGADFIARMHDGRKFTSGEFVVSNY
jgi:hypothetical protein